MPSPRRKFTPSEFDEIWDRYKRGEVSAGIARAYLSPFTVGPEVANSPVALERDIVVGDWQHVIHA